MGRLSWNIASAVQYMLKEQCRLRREIMQINPSVTGCYKEDSDLKKQKKTHLSSSNPVSWC